MKDVNKTIEKAMRSHGFYQRTAYMLSDSNQCNGIYICRGVAKDTQSDGERLTQISIWSERDHIFKDGEVVHAIQLIDEEGQNVIADWCVDLSVLNDCRVNNSGINTRACRNTSLGYLYSPRKR